MPAPTRAWVRLPSGRRLDLLSPTAFDWTDEDLAVGLSRTFRWGGHSVWPGAPLSVAQHSLAVLALRRERARPPLSVAEQRRELLHDAEEGLINFDCISPLKPFLGAGFGELQRRLQAVVALRYALPAWTAEAKRAHKACDVALAAAEAVHVAGWTREEVRSTLGIRAAVMEQDPLAAARATSPGGPGRPSARRSGSWRSCGGSPERPLGRASRSGLDARHEGGERMAKRRRGADRRQPLPDRRRGQPGRLRHRRRVAGPRRGRGRAVRQLRLRLGGRGRASARPPSPAAGARRRAAAAGPASRDGGRGRRAAARGLHDAVHGPRPLGRARREHPRRAERAGGVPRQRAAQGGVRLLQRRLWLRAGRVRRSGGDHAVPLGGRAAGRHPLRREQDHRRAALPRLPAPARARLRRAALLHRLWRAAALPRGQRALHHRDHGPGAARARRRRSSATAARPSTSSMWATSRAPTAWPSRARRRAWR